MNINTSQSTESLKGTDIAGSVSSTGDKKETSEASGFFDKLTALMFGSPEQTKGKGVDKQLQAAAPDSVSDPMAALQKLGWTKHQLEHLTAKELSKVANQQGIDVEQLTAMISQMPDAITTDKSSSSSAVVTDNNASEQSAMNVPAAMDEGKQLLGKLQQANQTLTKPASQASHGKDLPQTLTEAESMSSLQQKMVTNSSKTASEAMDVGLAERPISQKEFAQLVALKKQHPELSENDLKKLLIAQRMKNDENDDPALALSGIGHGAPSSQHAVTHNLSAASPDKSTSISDAMHKGTNQNSSDVIHKGMNHNSMPAQSVHMSAQHGMNESKATLQGHAVLATQDGSGPQPQPQGQQQAAGASLGQGANPMVATHLMATNPAKGGASSAIEKGLSEKALNALTEMKGTKRGPSSQESTLASQISSASGQQLSATQKVDGTQQAASPQLQLSKDGADQVAEKVHMMMSKNLKSIDIRLDPPEMGKMHIKMQMNNDGGATVHFTVASHHARDALEQSMPRLREMLSQQGVQLGGASVQQDGGSQQQSFASANGGQSQSQRHAGSDVAGGTQENLDGDVKLDLNVASKRDGISYYA
ncbi:MAG: flagellar hook-length control protein FliK [Vibrio sp.]